MFDTYQAQINSAGKREKLDIVECIYEEGGGCWT